MCLVIINRRPRPCRRSQALQIFLAWLLLSTVSAGEPPPSAAGKHVPGTRCGARCTVLVDDDRRTNRRTRAARSARPRSHSSSERGAALGVHVPSRLSPVAAAGLSLCGVSILPKEQQALAAPCRDGELQNRRNLRSRRCHHVSGGCCKCAIVGAMGARSPRRKCLTALFLDCLRIAPRRRCRQWLRRGLDGWQSNVVRSFSAPCLRDQCSFAGYFLSSADEPPSADRRYGGCVQRRFMLSLHCCWRSGGERSEGVVLLCFDDRALLCLRNCGMPAYPHVTLSSTHDRLAAQAGLVPTAWCVAITSPHCGPQNSRPLPAALQSPRAACCPSSLLALRVSCQIDLLCLRLRRAVFEFIETKPAEAFFTCAHSSPRRASTPARAARVPDSQTTWLQPRRRWEGAVHAVTKASSSTRSR